jgi:hypothetical protein
MRELEAEYEKAMGRRPTRLPDDHPDAWQWDYRGTKEERDQLLELLSQGAPEEPAAEQTSLDV